MEREGKPIAVGDDESSRPLVCGVDQAVGRRQVVDDSRRVVGVVGHIYN